MAAASVCAHLRMPLAQPVQGLPGQQKCHPLPHAPWQRRTAPPHASYGPGSSNVGLSLHAGWLHVYAEAAGRGRLPVSVALLRLKEGYTQVQPGRLKTMDPCAKLQCGPLRMVSTAYLRHDPAAASSRKAESWLRHIRSKLTLSFGPAFTTWPLQRTATHVSAEGHRARSSTDSGGGNSHTALLRRCALKACMPQA